MLDVRPAMELVRQEIEAVATTEHAGATSSPT
jgi:hypothetical protein